MTVYCDVIECGNNDSGKCIFKKCNVLEKAIQKTIDELKAQKLTNNSPKLDSGNGDCISRAAAMTEIQMIAERYTLAHEKMGEGRVEWSEYLVRMSDAIDVVRNLPSVEPYQEESV